MNSFRDSPWPLGIPLLAGLGLLLEGCRGDEAEFLPVDLGPRRTANLGGLRGLRRRASVAILAVLVAVGGSGCRQDSFVARNVVLVTLDTLRADHLGCYGYPRETSPVLDRMAAGGVRFDRAFAAMATTVPSHASLLTSRMPMDLDVLKNGHRLASDVPTLAQILGDQGFETAAFVSTNRHFVAGGLDRGFQMFDQPDLGETLYRPGAQTVRAAAGWLATRDHRRPLFLWVHLFDSHRPYEPLHRFEPEGTSERERLARFQILEHKVDLGVYAGDASAMLTTMDLYDGEVRAADTAVGELLAAARRAGLAATDPAAGTLWIVVGDHGEGLGTHRWSGHGKHIYNEQLRVPMIFFQEPPMAAAGEAPENTVELLDVLPTVLDLTGVEAPAGPRIRGLSLAPQLRGSQASNTDRRAFAQRRHFDPPRHPESLDLESANYEAGETFALQDQHFKYLLRTAGPDELYAISRDPYETENLIGRGLPEEEQYRRWLRQRISELRSAGRPQTVEDEDIERLKSLGYEQ